MLVELGNSRPTDTVEVVDPETGAITKTRGPAQYPRVEYLNIPEGNWGRPIGLDQRPDETYEEFERRDADHIAETTGLPLYSIPDEHDDDIFAQNPVTAPIAEALASVPLDQRAALRRELIIGHIMNPARGGLPEHEAFVAVADPLNGFWQHVSQGLVVPDFVAVDSHPGLEKMLAEHFGCLAGKPDELEDRYGTYLGGGHYPPGSSPDPLSGFRMGHTTFGRIDQAVGMFGFGFIGQSGVLTAVTATTATLAAGASITLNQLAGQWIYVGPNTSGVGTTVYGKIISNTASTTPVVTVDRWYAAATPGGAAATTPNATGSYLIASGGPPTMFVGLSTDTTAFSLGGADGTADALTIASLITGEITTVGAGLTRKIAPIGYSAGVVTLTPVHTANGTDVLPKVIAKAIASSSFLGTGNGVADYMTIYTPATVTISASGDQLTSTWSMTET